MSVKNRREIDHTYHKLIVRPDPDIGYRYIPNLYALLCHNNHSYPVVTNAQGFRSSFSFTDKNKIGFKILALGDSYLAGDGVSNQDRFSDILGERMGVSILNMGLPGSGTDQQLLIQEKIATEYHYDALLIAPFVRNLNRNLSPVMTFMDQAASFVIDWQTNRHLEINKSFFTLNIKTGSLSLHNHPVPSNTIRTIVKSANLPHLRKWYRAFRSFLLDAKFRTGLLQADPEYRDTANPDWLLMKALLLRMIRNAGNKPVFIVPFPRHQHIFLDSHPYYLERFNELKNAQVSVIDILPTLRKTCKHIGRKMLLPDGHFTPEVNRIIADCCEPVLRKTCAIRKTIKNTPPRLKIDKQHTFNIICEKGGSSVVLFRDRLPIAAAREEWFSRIPGDKSFPWHTIQYCLEEAQLSIVEVTSVTAIGNFSYIKNQLRQHFCFYGQIISGNTCAPSLTNVRIGPAFSDDEIISLLNLSGRKYMVADKKKIDNTLVQFLSKGLSVGIFSGRLEFACSPLSSRYIIGVGKDGGRLTKPFVASDGIVVCSPIETLNELTANKVAAIIFNNRIVTIHTTCNCNDSLK
jgi:carbamoyltransferase